ncbi:MAG: sulfatase family protein, partial [Planctomycetota bacterium]
MSNDANRPNVIYILADDMGYGDVRYLNKDCKFPTPNLDQLGRDGMAFTDAHSSSAVCTPSRYSIMTGRYCWRTFMKKGVLGGTDTSILGENRRTVANIFKENNYSTACVGKWHLGWEWQPKEGCEAKDIKESWVGDTAEWIDFTKPVKKGPTEFGFDYYYGISGSLDMPPYVYLENDMPVGIPDCWASDKEFVRGGPRLHWLRANNVLGHLTEKAVDYIHNQKDNPFFLYFPLTAPHGPIAPAPEFAGKSKISLYADFCMEVDHRVGQIMEALEYTGQTDNTMIIFTTDNGASSGVAECDMLEKRYGHYSSYIYRGYKSDIWDGGHRLPFLVRWPEKVKAGTYCNETTGIFDLHATVSDLLNYTCRPDEGEDSVSFLPALTGEKIDNNGREAVIHHSMSGKFAIRKDNWKMCYCPGSGGWASPTDKEAEEEKLPDFQLYNMKDDPEEKNNLIGKETEVEKELLSLLQK